MGLQAQQLGSGIVGGGIVVVSGLALSGLLMEPLRWQLVAAVLIAAAGFSLILDRIKLPVTSAFKVE